MLVPASFLLRRQTSAFRKPCPRTDNPVAVKADVKADAKADARTMNVVLLLVAASMPDSVVLRRRADSAVLVRPLAVLHPRADSASATLLRLRQGLVSGTFWNFLKDFCFSVG